jgi:hypothetical protein
LSGKPLENKVAQKAILAFDPEKYLPKKTEIVQFDLKQFLYMDLLLKEKEFRLALKEFDFSPFVQKFVWITCSSDAIIPMWAYMLAASYLTPLAQKIVFATNEAEATERFLIDIISKLDNSLFANQRVVVKGCGKVKVTANLYVALMEKIQPIAKAVNFGEACSMVPVSKQA